LAKKTNSDINKEIDPEIERLKAKSTQGAMNIVGDILNDPKVQGIIKNALVKETMKSAIIMSALFVGLLNLYGVAKQVLTFSWQVETIISLILVTIGLSYMLKNIFTGRKHD